MEEEILVISQEEGPFWDRTEVSLSELKDMPIKCEGGRGSHPRPDRRMPPQGRRDPYVALESTIAKQHRGS